MPQPSTNLINLSNQLAALAGMDRQILIEEWRRQYRASPPHRLSRDLLELGIAWKLQETLFGGLRKADATAFRGLAEAIATTGDIARAKPIRLKPGVRLIREWGGKTHEVTIVDGGYLWRDTVWTSLSTIATEITGAHWSGPRFFGLTSRAKPKEIPKQFEAGKPVERQSNVREIGEALDA